MASAFAATRAWKAVCPSSAGRARRSTNSRTAATSSPISGRSYMAPRAWTFLEQQLEQVDLGLGAAPADRGALDGRIAAPREGAVHHHADDPPPERPRDLPEAHARRVHRAAAGGLVAREELLARAEAADRELRAEAPGVHAEPAEVLHRIAHVCDLPVEDAADAVRPDEEIAVAEVAVHE